ncbi:hypothetical protein [Flavobacterium ginsenosidimutans]|uniref:hypothetical protein n=1 Tax=Flavobacterium ginsenosidimutans TaxID=687844 RepID=UPI003D992AEE
MYDYSIEHNALKINSSETKVFFKEVASSYFNDNYRAAVVTLYSVVMVDILNKLETLSDMYGDIIAENILSQIRTIQKANPVGAEWEKLLIEETKNRTDLLDTIDYSRILALRSDRHLCAHPVLDRGDKLYTPNRETVAAHIRNMLESVLQKPVILSKKILGTVLVDIASNAEILIGGELEKYVQSKYLQNLDGLTEVMLFRDLWKFVFRLQDENSSAHRELNYRLLKILYKRNRVVCDKKIKEDKKYYSTMSNSPDILIWIADFITEHGELFAEFTEDFKLLFKSYVQSDPDEMVICWFIEGDFLKHLSKLKENITGNFGIVELWPVDADPNAYEKLQAIARAKGFNSEFAEFISWRYQVSRNYDEADRIFHYLIKPNIELLTDTQLLEMCAGANDNSQACGRKKAGADHTFLKNAILERPNGADFPFADFKFVF